MRDHEESQKGGLMSFQEFVDGIIELAAKCGENVTVHFDYDEKAGKYVGIASNGMQFTGNSYSLKITARWGTGHQAQFELTAA